MENDIFSQNTSSQFVLSYELLALLRWLADHDTDKFKKIISAALSAGLQEEINKIDKTEESVLVADMQHSITDFLSIMESLLVEVMSEHVEKRARQQNLLPSIDQIDTAECDDNIVRFSLEKATAKLATNPKANPKELLFKEILKRWKPHNKNIKN
jgi:hypothetical protein